MGIISIVKQQKKKWTKYSNHSSESLYYENEGYCSSGSNNGINNSSSSECSIKNIDLPNGVTLKSNDNQKKLKKRRGRKFLPKFFAKFLKSKYNEAILATQSKNTNTSFNKNNNGSCNCSNEKGCSYCCCHCSSSIPARNELLEKLEKLDINNNDDTCIKHENNEKTIKPNSVVVHFKDTESHYNFDLNDSEKTVQRNNIQYLNCLDDKTNENNVDDNDESNIKISNKNNTKICKIIKSIKNSKINNKNNKNNNNKNNSKCFKYDSNDHFDFDNNGQSKDDTTEVNNSENESTVGTMVSDSTLDNFNFSREPIILNLRNKDTLAVLDDYLAEIIRTRLPKLLQEASKWNLMYSMDQHGASLSTLYRCIKECGPCLMVLKTSENELFGAFLSEPFDTENRGFYGTPECFLWKKTEFEFRKYGATDLNNYFLLADQTFIAMGGGKGNFGFYLDDDIQFGYSSKCDTFNNDILTKENEFECYGLEIWNFEF